MAIFPIKTKLKDDVIPLLLKLPYLYLESRLKSITTLIFATIFFTHITLLGFIQLFANRNPDYWLNHFLSTFGSLNMIISYVTLWTRQWDFYAIIDGFFSKFWPLNANPSDYAALKKQGMKAELHSLGTLVILTIVAIGFIPLDAYNCSHLATFEVIVERLGHKWGYLSAVPMYLSFFHAGFAVEACAASMKYMALHMKFQLAFLNDRLAKMQEVDRLRETHLLEDRKYQSGIRRELVACFQHYCLLERFASRINAMILYPIFGYVLGGIVVSLGVIANLKYTGVAKEFSVRPLIVGWSVVAVSGSFCIVGQLVEDESEKVFYSTVNLPWYLWNKENRKIVMLLLVATRERFTLSSAGIITMNHRLVITLYRLFYSSAMLLINI